MQATFTPATTAQRAENDSYAGELLATLSIGLDDTDPKIATSHDLARLLLSCEPSPIVSSVAA